jgi:hypothetical protein
MTEIKKRRKGQKKADGTTATPKPVCPKCGEDLKRNYTREVIDGKQRFVKAGWRCPNTTCDFITKKEMGEELEKGKGEGLLIREGQHIPIRYEEKEEQEE